jgi:outer membrane protein assembly factor BamB
VGALYVGTDTGLFTVPLGAAPSNATAADAGLAGLRVSALLIADGKVYAGTYDFNTTLAAVSVAADVATGVPAWSDFATGAVGPRRIYSLAAVGTTLLAATRGGLVSMATPGGSWTPASNGLTDPNGVVMSLFSDGTTVFAATGSNGIFAAPASAVLNWSPFNGNGSTVLPAFEVHQLRADGTSLFAATSGGLATFSGISASAAPTPTPTPTPTPAPVPAADSGGGALGGLWLLALALLVALLAALRKPGRAQ